MEEGERSVGFGETEELKQWIAEGLDEREREVQAVGRRRGVPAGLEPSTLEKEKQESLPSASEKSMNRLAS